MTGENQDLRKPEKDDSPENLAEMAEIFLQKGDYERSVHNYSKILSQNPERYDIRYKLAITLLLADNLEESKKELAEVLLHKMDLVEAHDALGVIYLQENKLTEAQQEFRTALALDLDATSPIIFWERHFCGSSNSPRRSRNSKQLWKPFQAAPGLWAPSAGLTLNKKTATRASSGLKRPRPLIRITPGLTIDSE